MMKKLIFLIALLGAVSFASSTYELFTGECYTDSPLGEKMDATYSIRYNDSLNKVLFYYDDGFIDVLIVLDNAALKVIRDNMLKFYKWDKVARNEKVDVFNREFPVSQVNVKYSATAVEQESGTARVKMMFSSSGGQSAFVMTFFGKNFHKIFMFDSWMVKVLQTNTLNENIQRAIKKHKDDEKKMDELFN